MDDQITLTELIGEGNYIESPMVPDHFELIVDALSEGPVSMNIQIGTTRVEVTVEYIGVIDIHEQVAQEESICVDVRGANCGFELYADPETTAETESNVGTSEAVETPTETVNDQ